MKVVDRVFMFNGTMLRDPDRAMSLDEVREFYAKDYPELNNGTISEAEPEEGRQVFKFKTSYGSKG